MLRKAAIPENYTTPTITKRMPALYTKVLDESKGIVEEIFSVMGNIDHGKDRLWPGAFTKTITERGSRVLVLDMHNTDSILRVIGKPIKIREIGKNELPVQIRQEYPDATGAVLAETQYLLDTPEGLGAFQRIKAGAITELSFGFDVLDEHWSTVKAKPTENGWQLDESGDDLKVRDITQVRLYEYSRVLWGMNPATSTVSVKDATGGDEDKAIVPYQNLPLADREKAWDQAGARRRVKDWAGGDTIDFAKYKKAFLWVDSEQAADTEGAYKFPIADVVDGTLTAVPKGISSAAGRIKSIPEGERAAAQRHLGRYYKKMAAEFDDDSVVAPWEKAKSFKSVSLTRLVSEIEGEFMETFNPPDECTYMPMEVFDDHLIVCSGWGAEREYYQVNFTTDDQGNIIFTPRAQWIAGSYQFVPTSGADSEDANETPEPTTPPAEPEGGDGMQMSKAMSADDAQKIADACRKLIETISPMLETDSGKAEAPSIETAATDKPDAKKDQPAAQTPNEAGPGASPPTETERQRAIKLIQLEQERSGGIKANGK